jgi:hypothetical protein
VQARSFKAPLRLLRLPLALLFYICIFPVFGEAAETPSPAPARSARPSAPAPLLAPPAQNLSTSRCDPCTLDIGQAIPPYDVRFRPRNMPDGRRVVEELRISRTDKPGWSQSLPVHDMTPLSQNQEFFIGTADINFDGYNDLLLATSRGVANTYADYWLFVPRKQAFSYLGNYPIFRVDADKQVLAAYERGGHGGLIYRAKSYRFIKGVLTLVESEKQEATDQEGVYRRSVFRLKDGKLRLTERELVKAPPPK